MRTIIVKIKSPEPICEITGKKTSMSFIMNEQFNFRIQGDFERYVRSLFDMVRKGKPVIDSEVSSIVEMVKTFNPYNPFNCSPFILEHIPSAYSIVNYNTLRNKINEDFTRSYSKNVIHRNSFELFYEKSIKEQTVNALTVYTMTLILGCLQARYFSEKFPSAEEFLYNKVKSYCVESGWTEKEIIKKDVIIRAKYKFDPKYVQNAVYVDSDVYQTTDLDEAIEIICNRAACPGNLFLFLNILLCGISDLEHRMLTREQRSITYFYGEDNLTTDEDGKIIVKDVSRLGGEDEIMEKEERWATNLAYEAAALHHLMMLLCKWIDNKELAV